MIHAVTLNTGIDDTYQVSKVSFGSVAEMLRYDSVPSGKGVNASRVARALGAEVTSYGLIGQDEKSYFDGQLRRLGIDSVTVGLDQTTRHNLTLLAKSGNEPAAHFRAEGFRGSLEGPILELLGELLQRVRRGDIVSLHGSTPREASLDTWCNFARSAKDKGATVYVDAYGPALLDLIGSGCVKLCKINAEEADVLASSNDRAGESLSRTGLLRMAESGVQVPIITLGRRGLVTLAGGDFAFIQCEVDCERQFVGAGDAMMGALLQSFQERQADAVEICKYAVSIAAAWVEGEATANLKTRGAQLLGRTVARKEPAKQD